MSQVFGKSYLKLDDECQVKKMSWQFSVFIQTFTDFPVYITITTFVFIRTGRMDDHSPLSTGLIGLFSHILKNEIHRLKH